MSNQLVFLNLEDEIDDQQKSMKLCNRFHLSKNSGVLKNFYHYAVKCNLNFPQNTYDRTMVWNLITAVQISWHKCI